MGMVVEERKAMMSKTDAEVWHRRLGHASYNKLSRVGFLENISLNVKDYVCDACCKAKQTRLPFPRSSIKTVACFDMIHCDIWGKYRKPSTTHSNFFLTIVDDYSRAVWTYLIKHKSDAGECLINFQRHVKTQFGKMIKRIRCDNGGEFTSNKMKSFYSHEGIILETSCPHTPQQNGVVERKHRHLLETARALMFQASLPRKFWGECIQASTYLINRMPSKVINNQTPYEIIFNEKPDYDRLRVFGCLVYYWSTETGGDKFVFRGRPGVFIGYPTGTKGYKIYDVENGKIVTSRDVTFVEKDFPFEKVKNQTDDRTIFQPPQFDYEEYVTNGPKPNKGPNPEISSQQEVSDGLAGINDTSCDGPIDDIGPVEHENTVNVQPDQNEGNDEATQPTSPMSPHEENAPSPHVHNTDESAPTTSKRTRIPSKRLDGYEVKLPPSVDHQRTTPSQPSSTVHSLAHYVSYEKFTNSHRAYLTAISENNEPTNFREAMQDKRWVEAMKREIHALEANETWTLEQLPQGKRPIDSKWVYKIKYKPNGEVERFKARLVAKGFTQMEGVDYHETFAPVAKLVTVRTLLSVAVKRDWPTHQLDVNNAFLHGDLDEEVYMRIPQGFSKQNETRVCRLRKSLYGLKQASRNWYQKFTRALLEVGYIQSKADYSLFTHKAGNLFVAILIYVDDVIITGNNSIKIEETKAYLDKRFSIKDLGPLKYFLGIEVARTSEGIVLNQRKYALDILEDSGMLGCRPSPFPMEQNVKLGTCEESERVDASMYRRLIGRLLYLQATRPDLAYSVNILSQFVSDP
ncbi:putative RNA-directed DNA polymerase [Helianthus annuus]|nr:putative RNA-directed DNA polymerase [Helianthus annuus]